MEAPKDREEVSRAEPQEGEITTGGMMRAPFRPEVANQAGRIDLGKILIVGSVDVSGYYASGASDGLPQTHPDQATTLYSPEEQ